MREITPDRLARVLGIPPEVLGFAPLDELVHSARWIRERPLEYMWGLAHEHYVRTGRDLEEFVVSAPMYLRLHDAVWRSPEIGARYAITYQHPSREVTLWGIPLRRARVWHLV